MDSVYASMENMIGCYASYSHVIISTLFILKLGEAMDSLFDYLTVLGFFMIPYLPRINLRVRQFFRLKKYQILFHEWGKEGHLEEKALDFYNSQNRFSKYRLIGDLIRIVRGPLLGKQERLRSDAQTALTAISIEDVRAYGRLIFAPPVLPPLPQGFSVIGRWFSYQSDKEGERQLLLTKTYASSERRQAGKPAEDLVF